MPDNNNRELVAIDETVHETYKQLTEGSDAISAPFRTMKDVFMWAAFLGYQQGIRRKLEGKRVSIFRWAQFSLETDIPLLKALAIVEDGVESLQSQDKILIIAEEYANAGIHELQAAVLGRSGQQLWNLVSILEPKDE